MDRPGLEDAFRHAVYSVETAVGTVQFRIGERIEGLDGRVFAMVTAYNPGGVQQSLAANREANESLRRELAARAAVLTEGFSHDGNGAHGEPQFAVFGLGRHDVLAVAARFGQAAIVWFDGETAELAWVGGAPRAAGS